VNIDHRGLRPMLNSTHVIFPLSPLFLIPITDKL
jgi:hypothetical protein